MAYSIEVGVEMLNSGCVFDRHRDAIVASCSGRKLLMAYNISGRSAKYAILALG